MTQSREFVVDAADLDPTRSEFGAISDIQTLGRTHFIGIGGAGMSVLAEMLHQQGIAVTGSDNESTAKTDHLRQLGIPVFLGQRAENVQGCRTVVYSSAIKASNPEIREAAAQGAHLVHRSDVLALLMNAKRAVAVAGTHGKTTTSSLLAHILRTAGTGRLADPSYAIGGSIQKDDGGELDGGHAGSGEVLVAEADESDGSFVKYHPLIAIITNVEADHLDHYGSPERYRSAFVHYAGQALGNVIVCADDPGARSVLRSMTPDEASRTIAYSTDRDISSKAGDVGAFVWIASESESAHSGEEHCVIHLPAGLAGSSSSRQIGVSLKIPGLHNARNATAAIVAATLLGMDPHAAAQAAGSFLGAVRRFQIRGERGGVTVVDDYAHHPTEIAALLDAARRRYPHARLHVLFQPHLFSRTRVFAGQFAEALAKADDVVVTAIYPARERQEDYPDVGADTIVRAASGLIHEPGEAWIEGVDDMHVGALRIAARAHRGDVVFTVGAGSISSMSRVLLDALPSGGDHREAS